MNEKRKIYSVAELNRAARMTLENGIGEVWVEGEISPHSTLQRPLVFHTQGRSRGGFLRNV